MSSQAGSESGSSSIGEDSILGQVQREASSSRSRSVSNGQAQDSPNDHGIDGSVEDSSHEDLIDAGSSDAEPNAIDLAKYRDRLAAHAQDVWRHFHRPKRLRVFPPKSSSTLQISSIPEHLPETELNEAEPSTFQERISPPEWTEAEQSAFFPSLARHSRLRPDLISDDLDGTKTAVQVSHYISLLKAASHRLIQSDQYRQSGARRIRALPSAKEVPAHWTALEEEAARQLTVQESLIRQSPVPEKVIQDSVQISGSSHGGPVPWDSQVLNALLFLRQQASKAGQPGISAHIELKQRGTLASSVSVFRLEDLLYKMVSRTRTAKKAKGEGNAAWLRYSQTHPVPPLPKPKRLGGAQRSKILPSGNKEADGRNKERAAAEEAEEIESAHGGAAYRLILRAIELGFLLRATPVANSTKKKNDNSMPRFYVHLARVGTGTRHKRHRDVHSDTPAPLPRKLLRETQLVWADKLPVDLLEEMGARELVQWARTAKEKLQEGTEAALDRILSSVSIEEGHWIASLLQSDSSGSIPLDRPNNNTGSTTSVDPLVSLTSKERNRVRMRIKRYEAEYGPLQSDAVSNFLVPPMEKGTRLPRIGMRGVQERGSGKSSILEPFRDVIYALPPEKRATARSRIRTRIVRWGLQAALRTGFDAWSDGITPGRPAPWQSSPTPGATETTSPGEVQQAAPDPSPAPDTEVVSSMPEANAEVLNRPTSETTTGNNGVAASTIDRAKDEASFGDKRAERFRQIGATRQDISGRLAELTGQTTLHSLNLHGLFHHLQVMNEKTRCLTSEGVEGERPPKEVATRLDMLRLLPDIGAKFRSFVEQTARGALRQAQQDQKASISAAEVKQVLRGRYQVASVAEMRKREREAVQGASRALTEEERQDAIANMEWDPPVDWQSQMHLAADKDYTSLGCLSQQDGSLSRALTTLSSLGKRKHRDTSQSGAASGLDEDEDGEEEEELFDSNAEAAEVQAVRSIWAPSASSQRQKDRADEAIPPMWRGFYWPNRTMLGPGELSDESVTESDESDQASGAETDSEAESKGWWEDLARQDQQQDERNLQGEWEKWFGGKARLPAPAPAPASLETASRDQEDEAAGDGPEGEGEEAADPGETLAMGGNQDEDEEGEGSDAMPDWLQEMMDAKKNRKGSEEEQGGDDDSVGEMSSAEEGDRDGQGGSDAEDRQDDDDDDDDEMAED